MKFSLTPEPIVAMNSPAIELPTFPEPILPLDPLILPSPNPPPPSQPRLPAFPQALLPLSDDTFFSPAPVTLASSQAGPFLSPARVAPTPSQTGPMTAPAAEGAPKDVIEISSDEDDDAPPPKRRRRESTPISIIYSEDEIQSNTSNKENVPAGKAESSPPPFVFIPYPPKTIVERTQPVPTSGSTMSIADKFRAIVSRNKDSKSGRLLVPPSENDADAAANALFNALVQNVPSNVLQETVEKMNAELVQRGDVVAAVKEEVAVNEDDVKMETENTAKKEDAEDADDEDDAHSLFSRASSESWQANVLISNAAPFADIYINETERLPRVLPGPAITLNIRARWELRVIIWYRVSRCLPLAVRRSTDLGPSMTSHRASSPSSSTLPMACSVSRRNG